MDIDIDLSQIKLETERLVLRAWRADDLIDLFEYASVAGVGEMAGWKHHESLEVSRSILRSFIEGKHCFAIVYKAHNKVIGSLGLHASWANYDPNYADLTQKEIGYVLSKDYWGMGLMPEAVKALIWFCFHACGVDALTIEHFVSNAQSKRVIEKCGFSFVKYGQMFVEALQATYQDQKYILLRNRDGNKLAFQSVAMTD